MSRNSPSLSKARAAVPVMRAVSSHSSQVMNHSSSTLSPNCATPHRQGRGPSLKPASPLLALRWVASLPDAPDARFCLQGGCRAALLRRSKPSRCQM